MEEGKPSVTALAVANGIAALWRSDEYKHLIDPEMGWMSEMYVQEAIKQFDFTTEPAGIKKEMLRSVVSRRPGFAKTPEEAVKILGNIIDGWPFQFAGRKAAVEVEIRKDIVEGRKTQIVILGEGFDTLANRLVMDYPHVTFYANDQAATQNIRKAVESGRKYKNRFGEVPKNIVYFTDDLSKVSLEDAFKRLEKEHGLKRDRKTAVVAEAVLFYLKQDVIGTTFKTIHDFFGDKASMIASFLDANKANPAGQGLNATGEPLFSFHSYRNVCELAARYGAAVTGYSPGAMLKRDYGCPDVCRQFANPDSEDYYKFQFVSKQDAADRLDIASAEKTMHVQKILEQPEFYEVLEGQNPKKIEGLKALLLSGAPPRCVERLHSSIASGPFSVTVRNKDIKGIYSALTDVLLLEQMPPQRVRRDPEESLKHAQTTLSFRQLSDVN